MKGENAADEQMEIFLAVSAECNDDCHCGVHWTEIKRLINCLALAGYWRDYKNSIKESLTISSKINNNFSI